jgi:hypothetical protein
MKRRILLPVALLILGGTVLAQNGNVNTTAPRLILLKSVQIDGDVIHLQGVRVVFPNGASLTADEGVAHSMTGTIDLSGNVRLTGMKPAPAAK